MTEQELQQQRAQLWRLNGNPIRTVEDAKSFLDATGFCLMYPVRALPLAPSFFAAYAGSADNLPDAKHAFADPRNAPATDLMIRLLRAHDAYEINLLPESGLLVSAACFPFMYALFGDRNPKATPKRLSPLALKAFETIQKHGPLSKKRLQELIGREPSGAVLERALNELWSMLKITRVDYQENSGAYWDLLYRWSPEAVMEGSRIAASEAISALLGKYLESVLAASQEEVEHLFSHLSARSKVREAIHALLAARELSLLNVGSRSLLHLTPAATPHQGSIHG